MLETKGLTKEFDGFRAVDNLNFYLEKGELHCIIGPNGSGKTTFFSLISGFLKPTNGDIIFNNEKITNLMPHQIAQRGIIRKFQVPNVYNFFTLHENLKIPSQIKLEGKILLFTRSSIKVGKKIDEILEIIQLKDKKKEVAGELSHGEMQWLEIGMTLAMEPSLLLLDEPTAGMTRDETKKTAEIIRGISNVTTIIIIEHDIQFIREVSRKITVMHNGSILTEGPLEQIENDERVRNVYLGKEK
ncbi:ATP-binding cassette domain-containing protein [Candidatus Gottesmanbacteria bacterium]|nr:ATP-binding cassette domain-containing protein [Candidatus Gottesmanbacteria bacterium]